MKRTLGFAMLGAAVFAACESDSLGPQSGPLRLEASIGRSTLGALDTTSIVYRVRNVGSDTISLDFSGCDLRRYIVTYDNDPVMGWGCRSPVWRTLPPGGEYTTSVLVRACTPSYQGTVFPQNRYKAYAHFAHPDYEMRSRTIEFRVICT